MLIRNVALFTSAAVLSTLPLAAHADDSLTIYNQDFAVVRETVPLNLTAGVNHVTFNDITYHVEPDSVILRDPAGKRTLNILEQNYRADPVSQDLMLSQFEGQTIDFQVTHGDKTEIIQGKIVRSGYITPNSDNSRNYRRYYEPQPPEDPSHKPIIEVDGKMQFGLPGTPLFPSLPNDSIFKPTLDWNIQSDQAGPLDAELGYITDGMNWTAAYNVIAPLTGEYVDLVGWVTIDNETGRTFSNATIKLMAGDFNKLRSQLTSYAATSISNDAGYGGQPQTSEKSFENAHLYTINHPTTLRDRETKQVEFMTVSHVHSRLVYVYDPMSMVLDGDDLRDDQVHLEPGFGEATSPKVLTMREIVNSEANHLGIPLPKGRMRFYRQDTDGQLQFTGENDIDHTAKDETIRIYTGNAFDLTGERKEADYNVDIHGHKAQESFAITLRNHKKTTATVQVVEHFYRTANWKITKSTAPYTKKDARTIEFTVDVPPGATKEVDYTAHYAW